jgi:hypothetical protein
LCIFLFFKIRKRRHAPENNVQYVERYSVTKEEEEEEEEEITMNTDRELWQEPENKNRIR